jgi:hypothetical protein
MLAGARLTLKRSRGGPSCALRLQVITSSAGYCSGSSRMVSRRSSELSGGDGAFPAAAAAAAAAAPLPDCPSAAPGAAAAPSASAASISRPLISNSQEGGSAQACAHVSTDAEAA